MSTHNIGFYEDLRKIIFQLSSNFIKYAPYLFFCSLVTWFMFQYAMSEEQMSRVTRKPTFCICENKDADQLRGNREADQRVCFRYPDSTIPLISKSEISSL